MEITRKYKEISIPEGFIPVVCSLLLLHRRALAAAFAFWIKAPQGFTTIALSVLAILLFVIYLYQKREDGVRLQSSLILLAVMLAVDCVSLGLAPNAAGEELFQGFIRYCVPAAFIVSFVEDYRLFVKTYCIFAVILLIICGPLPFLGGAAIYRDMGQFASGMAYGEWIMVPCFAGVYLLRKKFRIRWMIILEILIFALTLVYANRASILAVPVMIILYEIWFERKKGMRFCLKWIIIFLVLILVLMNLESILTFIQEQILIPSGISSRAFRKYIQVLQTGGADTRYLTSGRDNLTRSAMELFRQSPFFGIGIGMFSVFTTSPYTHNIVTDAYSTFGIFYGTFIVVVTIKAVYNMFVLRDRDRKMMLLILFIITFPRLLLSKTFVNDVPYWMFLIFALSKGRDDRTIKDTADINTNKHGLSIK